MQCLTKITAVALLPLVAACAKGPDSIAPVSMGNAYAGVACETVSRELATERLTLEALESKQRGAVAGDAFGVFLVGVPISSLTGGDVAGEIGASKGKVLALEGRARACGVL